MNLSALVNLFGPYKIALLITQMIQLISNIISTNVGDITGF